LLRGQRAVKGADMVACRQIKPVAQRCKSRIGFNHPAACISHAQAIIDAAHHVRNDRAGQFAAPVGLEGQQRVNRVKTEPGDGKADQQRRNRRWQEKVQRQAKQRQPKACLGGKQAFGQPERMPAAPDAVHGRQKGSQARHAADPQVQSPLNG